MKNLLLTLVAFSVLLLIGCQESSIIDPIQDTQLQKNDDPSVTTGTIMLEGALNDPHPVMNSNYLVNGEIKYQHTLQRLDPIPPNPQLMVSLSLSVSANFTYLCTVCSPQPDNASVGSIITDTNDNLYVPEDGIYMLEKTFSIQGRDDGMVLKCRFHLTTDGIGLDEMWLELNDRGQTNSELTKNAEQNPIPDPPIVGNEYD
jgi:hypothetical protein